MHKILALLALTAVVSLAPAQGSATRYGSGCGAVGSPPPLLTWVGAQTGTYPRIGGNFTFDWSQAPHGISPVHEDRPFLLLGLSQLNIDLSAVLQPLLPGQPGGCLLLVDPLVVVAAPQVSSSSFDWQYTLGIPNDSSILGYPLNAQVLIRYTRFSSGASWFRVTNGVACIVGV